VTRERAIALLVAVASGDSVPEGILADFLGALLAAPGVGEAVLALQEPGRAVHHATRAAAAFLRVDEALGARRVGHDR
jgi:hypothetical protein